MAAGMRSISVRITGDAKGLDRAAKAAERSMGRVNSAIESAGKAAVPALAAAVGVLGAAVAPAFAGAFAAGVLLAIGGGFLGAGLMLAAKDASVGKAAQQLKNRFMDIDTVQLEEKYKAAQERMSQASTSESKKRAAAELSEAKKALDEAQAYNRKNFSLRDAAKPLVQPLVQALKIFQDSASTVIPQVGAVFEKFAPIVTALARGIVGLIQNALPGLAKGAESSVPAFESLANFLPTVGTWIGNIVVKMSELFGWAMKNRQAIADFLSVVVPIVGIFMGIIAAIKIWIAVQAALNIVMSLNPIGLIIIAVAALIAIIAVIATRTRFFQNVWASAWGGIKAAAGAVGSWFRDTVWNRWIRGAWDGIVNKGKSVVDWFRGLPGRLGSALSSIGNRIVSPFRSAFNGIVRLWNSTVGSLSFSIPGWVPGVGGNSWSAPRLSERASGGPVSAGRSYLVGERGPEVITMGSSNGNVIPNRELGGSGDTYEFTINLADEVQKVIRISNRELKARAGARRAHA